MEKKYIFLIITVVVVIGLVFGINVYVNNKNEESNELLSGKYYAEITVKDYGDIIVELDADAAPITVTNFVNLVNNKYYDGTVFHRIIEGFMIQGGDTGRNLKTIKGEFSKNGVKNTISHTRGTISMARSDADPDTASDQFFIVHEDYPSLDGTYAAFGHVISGMDIVDEIAKVETMEGTNGIVDEKNRPVIESIELVDVATTYGEDE